MYNTKRRIEIPFLEGGTTSVKLPRGILEQNLTLSAQYSVNVGTAGAAVRARGVPIRRIQVLTDGGKVLHSIRPQTAIRMAEVYEQTGLANLVSPCSGFGVGVQTGSCDIPLFFGMPFSIDKLLTALPTWAYDEITLVVDWGTVTDLLTGAPVGPITMIESFVTLNGVTGLGNVGDGKALARALGVAVTSYREYASAAANGAFQIILPRTADIRAVLLEVEDTTTQNEPTNNGLNSVTFLENNVVRVFSNVKARALRGDNAKVFGLLNGMPPGLYIIEFAEDKNIADIYEAPRKDDASLFLDVPAGSYNIRATVWGIEPAKRIA